jgi:hypothetical protein
MASWLSWDAAQRSQASGRQQPAMAAQLGEGAQQGAAERPFRRPEFPSLPGDLTPSNRPVRTCVPGGVVEDAAAWSRHATRPVGSTPSQPVEAGTAIGRSEPVRRSRGGLGPCPAQEAVFLQARNVRGFLPPEGNQVVVGSHSTLLSVGGLEAPERASSPKPSDEP